MNTLHRNISIPHYPVKVIQFGEGNFLRAFVDWMIDVLNEKANYQGSVAMLQPLPGGMALKLAAQDGLYHHLRQGLENGQRVDDLRQITCVSQCIDPYTQTDQYFALGTIPTAELLFSNTTEAGIVFEKEPLPQSGKLATTFPGKLTQLLNHRFKHFQGDATKGLAIVPCELIDQNGTKLRNAILSYVQHWQLGADFEDWVKTACSFANTLVDRIVPGYPKDEIEAITVRIGAVDNMVVKSESFHLFVIQGDERVRKAFPAHLHGLNVKYVDDITPYRTQKVRILNGAHTSMVPIGLLYGLETVRETMENAFTGKLLRELIFEEIVPTIQLSGEDPQEFADQVISRFLNPYIRHELMSIALNSISKFKVRVLPTMLDYQRLQGKLPQRLVFAMACLLRLYTSDNFALKDDESYLRFMAEIRFFAVPKLIEAFLSNQDFWDQDLTQVTGLVEQLTQQFEIILQQEPREVIENF